MKYLIKDHLSCAVILENKMEMMISAESVGLVRANIKKTHHNPCGGAEVQLDDEAVPPGQEGGPSGRLQHVGVNGWGEILLPSFRQDAQ